MPSHAWGQSYFHPSVQRHLKKQNDPEYWAALLKRQALCEGNFAAQKWGHNLTRILRRDLESAEDHCLLSATALNLKRLIKYGIWRHDGVFLLSCCSIRRYYLYYVNSSTVKTDSNKLGKYYRSSNRCLFQRKAFMILASLQIFEGHLSSIQSHAFPEHIFYRRQSTVPHKHF